MHEWHGGKGKRFTRVALIEMTEVISREQEIYQIRRGANNTSTPLKKNIITTYFARMAKE